MLAVRAEGDDRNRQARGIHRRQQILDAAVDLFSSKGYRAGGVAALAERVGMTPPGVLYYFGSKERLLREVVAERDRVDLAELRDTVRLADLRDIGRHNAATGRLTRLFAILAAENFDDDDPLHEFFVDRFEETRAFWRQVLRSEQREGRVRADLDVDAVATEALATILGLEIQWLMDPTTVDLAGATTRYVDRLITSIAAPPPLESRST